MLRTAFLSFILLVSLSCSSATLLGKSISRRQSDPQYCQAIEGFDCKCSYYRVTCTTDRDLPSPLNIVQNEKNKYQSVELVITAQRDITVTDQTFEPVKELYKVEGDNLEFRVKFEKFTGLNLASSGIFNRVFPDNLPSHAKKHVALEIYNPDVRPTDNVGLFQNLNVDSLELYALYPFRGTFQELFQGANIKYLRLSGGDIQSNLAQPFTGNIGRLELAKQANALSVQNFPVYPAHELVINAFYITEFNSEHPPNYANLGELRVYSPERIPANAFRQFPNIHTLQLSSDKEIDPQALSGLNKLEKLTIKDTKPSIELLNSVPSVKEFETNIEKLDEHTQCQLLEKLANGQVAVQAIPNGRECTCVSAYLDTAAGRTPCDAQDCERSSCAAIKNNYDSSTRKFNAPPAISRSDGSNALHPREARVYSAPFQVSNQDQEKLQHAAPPPTPQPTDEHQHPDDGSRRPDQHDRDDHGQGHVDPSDEQHSWQTYPPVDRYPDLNEEDNTRKNPNENSDWGDNRNNPDSEYPPNTENNPNENRQSDHQDNYEHENHIPPTAIVDSDPVYTETPEIDADDTTTLAPNDDDAHSGHEGHGEGDHREGGESTTPVDDNGNRQQEGEGNENRPDAGEGGQQIPTVDQHGNVEGGSVNGTETTSPQKRGMSWLPIIIIAAGIGALILVGLVVLFIRKRRSNKGYTAPPGEAAQPRSPAKA